MMAATEGGAATCQICMDTSQRQAQGWLVCDGLAAAAVRDGWMATKIGMSSLASVNEGIWHALQTV